MGELNSTVESRAQGAPQQLAEVLFENDGCLALAGRRMLPAGRGPVDVSVLVPTRNEGVNVRILTQRLCHQMSSGDRSWELVFLDDSDDTTPVTIADVARSHPEVRVLHREPGGRSGGLSGAVVAGFAVARGRVIVVMDGDLQHPPEVARELATLVLTDHCDIAIASRYVSGASPAGLDSRWRRLASRVCTALTHAVVPQTRAVRDPMSGFFAVSADTLRGHRLRPHGFKILMEVLARNRPARVAELPYRLARRGAGSSKAGPSEGLRFLRHLTRVARPSPQTMIRAARRLALLAPVGGILAVQAWLSLRLIWRNTAFLDEANYLSAGRWVLTTWAHGGADMHFAAYFSGAPVIYPVLASLIGSVGGLPAARLMSLGFMLAATLLGYATARRLWGRPAGWLAAAVFVTTEGTQFLGALATFDAMSLMLISLAAWIVVRQAATAPYGGAIFLAIPALALANATKYASTIFDPVVLALAFFVILDRHGLRPALRMTAILTAGLGICLAMMVGFAPGDYLTGILATTITRATAGSSAGVVLVSAAAWVGAIAAIAGIASLTAALLAWRHKLSWAMVGTLAVLTLAAAIAPIEQARIHTTTSLFKHVTFGAWFAAIAAGWLLARLVGGGRWVAPRAAVLMAALIPLGLVGTAQAQRLYAEWPNSSGLVATLRPMVSGRSMPVLMDDAEVARYYLGNALSLPHWIDTYSFEYTAPGSDVELAGQRAYVTAVEDGYFSVIALDFSEERSVDDAIVSAIHAGRRYVWVADVPADDVFGRGSYVIWRLAPRTS
ncbi:MAG TPA: glycosyltransferase [Candidatus Binatia bacterium]|nr:glycosyltransferase [Candidatus Binatia bacterium]